MHTGGRRRSKGQRLLYWFRTPPGVRVGRSPIDEEAIRLLEEHNPDVEFDWTRILKDPVPAESPRRESRPSREGRDRRREPRGPQRPFDQPPAPIPQREQPAMSEDVEGQGYAPPEDAEAAPPEVIPREDAPAPAPLSYDEEAAAQLASTAAGQAGEADEPGEEPTFAALSAADEGSASYQRLGAEGLVRLRARYAEVMARIAEQPIDEEAREQLKTRAERLNPDGWVTADEVAAALEQYESVFEELRALVGRDPRRRRRRGR